MMVTGVVIKGDGIAGALFGTPTANLAVASLPPDLAPGVYAGRVTIGDRAYRGAICYGADSKQKFEVHVLDFSGDLVGETITVDVLARVSDLVPWESTEQMRQKIINDIALVRLSHL